MRVVAVCVFSKDRQRHFGPRAGLLSFPTLVAQLNFVLPFSGAIVDEPASTHIKTIVSLAHDGFVIRYVYVDWCLMFFFGAQPRDYQD
ncbi:hypothetical protein F4781DRAFT_407595 [Annulohypoxylon bovei var. microspora]|nr:hypothetical protein F4781DRAFT_407595 [Annulohypoxylon bovei var. microspora]